MKANKKHIKITIGILVLIVLAGIWLLTIKKHQENTENSEEKSVNTQIEEKDNGMYAVHNIKKLVITQSGKKTMEVIKDTSDIGNSFKTSDMRMIYPYDERVASDKFDALIEILDSIEALDNINDSPLSSADYGFDKDITVFIEEDSGAKHTLKIGKTDENGNVYTMYNDEQAVFTINPSLKNEIEAMNAFDYIDKLAHIYSIKDVSSIEISYHNKKHILAIQRSGDKVYTVDGNKINEDNFKTIYQEVIGVDIIDFATGVSKGEKVGEVTFVMMNGDRETTDYYEYDNQKLLVVKPNGKQYLTLKKYIENIVSSIE